jgi:nicotinamidase-related amidase
MRLKREDVALTVVDVQTKLLAAMPEDGQQTLLRNITLLLELAGYLQIPVIASEQYPQGLGPTVPAVAEALAKLNPRPRIFDKLDFSAAVHPMFEQFLGGHRRKTMIVVGIETHACVYQTARDLSERGFSVVVPADAVCSRRGEDEHAALQLIEREGGIIASTELVIFDLVGRAEGAAWSAIRKKLK